jgi:hypothetical protein
MVNFQSVCEISYSSPSWVCVCDDYDFVPSINELRRELVDVAFHSPRLGEEEVTDHSNVVRHHEQAAAWVAGTRLDRLKIIVLPLEIDVEKTVLRYRGVMFGSRRGWVFKGGDMRQYNS